MNKSKLQQELKQNHPFDSAATEAVISIHRTADRIRARLNALLRSFQLTTQQYNVLRILRGAGETGLPTLEIRQRMIESNPGITRLLDRLVTKGLVHRQRCPTDRRQVLCWATPEALELLARLDQPVVEINRQMMAVLDEDQQQQLIQLLDLVRSTVGTV
ncbi:MAG: MarR family transcriptional regulator [Thermoanaerobaculia bacterium]|nr:MarR family transcriptional regulator [Thermoanaerobaculia bacterium]